LPLLWRWAGEDGLFLDQEVFQWHSHRFRDGFRHEGEFFLGSRLLRTGFLDWVFQSVVQFFHFCFDGGEGFFQSSGLPASGFNLPEKFRQDVALCAQPDNLPGSFRFAVGGLRAQDPEKMLFVFTKIAIAEMVSETLELLLGTIGLGGKLFEGGFGE